MWLTSQLHYIQGFGGFFFLTLKGTRMLKTCKCFVKRGSLIFRANIFNMLSVQLHMMLWGPRASQSSLCVMHRPSICPQRRLSLASQVFSSPGVRLSLIKKEIFQIFHNTHVTPSGNKVVSLCLHLPQRDDCLDLICSEPHWLRIVKTVWTTNLVRPRGDLRVRCLS